MPAKVQIIVDAIDKATRELKGINKEVKQLGTTGKKTSRNVDLLGTAMKAMGALYAAKEVAQLVMELTDLGAQAERTERVFGNISGGAGAAADNLEAMRQATRGTMSEMDMMLNASKLMQMGLANNSDELGRLTEMATRLGTAMGMTATKSMDDFAMMLANKSTPRLDQFGLSSGKVRERWNELKETMGDDEAFKLAVLEQGEEALERLGEATEDAALKAEQGTAAWADLRAEIGRRLTGALNTAATATGDFARSWADALKVTREMPVRVDELNDELQNEIRIHGYTTDVLDRLANLRDKYNRYLELNRGQLSDYAEMERHAAEAVEGHAGVLGDAQPIFVKQGQIIDTWAARYQGQADALGAVSKNTLDARDAMEEQAAKAEEVAGRLEAYRKALAESAVEAGNLAMELKGATEAEIAKELVGMLDPEELGAAAYGTAVESIGLEFDLMDKKSLELAKNLPKLASAINEGLLPAEDAAEALGLLVDEAGDGVVNFDNLLEQMGLLPEYSKPMNEKLTEMEEKLEPLPQSLGDVAGGIEETGSNAANATPQIEGYISQLQILQQVASSAKRGHYVPTPTGAPTPTGPSGEFQHGGTVPGARGTPQLVIAHGGEEIVPAHRAGGAAPPATTIQVNNHFGTLTFFEDERAVSQLADRITMSIQRSGGFRNAYRRV